LRFYHRNHVFFFSFSPPICATFPIHVILLHLSTLISDELHSRCHSLLCNVLQPSEIAKEILVRPYNIKFHEKPRIL
jgi:hypothetical protein